MKNINYVAKIIEDINLENIANKHPYTTFLIGFVGIPILSLLVVGICTSIIILPVCFICGWL